MPPVLFLLPSSTIPRALRLPALIFAACALANCGDIKVSPFADCKVTPTALDFGSVDVGSSADRTFSVTNSGTSTLSGSVSESCGDLAIMGDASYSLGPGQSKTFTLRFTPSGAGSHPCTVSIGDCSSVRTTGQGVAPSAGCEVTPTTLGFGTVEVGSTADASFTIKNTGGVNLSGTVVESCSEFSLVGDGSYDLAPNQQTTVTVRFAPTSGGSKSCTIATGGVCSDVSATGTGQVPTPTPQCQVSTTTLAFGTVAVGQSATRTFTITNVGSGTLSGTVTESCPDFSIDSGASYSLGASQSATVTVRFAPTSDGAKSCTLDTGGSCANVSATGTGQTPPPPTPRCQVSTTTLAFGTVAVGQSATKTFTITNVGGGTLSGTVSESCGDFSIDGSASYSLSASQSATITVRFTPLTPGDQSCTIATGADCASISASGTGQLLTGTCRLSATTLDFHDVSFDTTADLPLTITNTGLGTLSGTLSESCAEFSIVGTATYSLAPTQSATFTLRFAPTAVGDYSCRLDPGSSCGAVTLKGKGAPLPQCELAATSWDFGEVEVTKHVDHTIDVRNVGGGQLCGTATESCEAFLIVSAASYCAIPGTPYHLKIRFQPPGTGSFECVIDPGSGCPTILVKGVGK